MPLPRRNIIISVETCRIKRKPNFFASQRHHDIAVAIAAVAECDRRSRADAARRRGRRVARPRARHRRSHAFFCWPNALGHHVALGDAQAPRRAW